MQQINARQMAELKAILAKVGLDVKRKPKSKVKSNGLTIWARRRIARAYKGPSVLECGKHGDWEYRDIGFPFYVRLWKNPDQPTMWGDGVEPRFDRDAIDRWIKQAQPRRKLLTYQPEA